VIAVVVGQQDPVKVVRSDAEAAQEAGDAAEGDAALDQQRGAL
jgi:hypothetical protein